MPTRINQIPTITIDELSDHILDELSDHITSGISNDVINWSDPSYGAVTYSSPKTFGPNVSGVNTGLGGTGYTYTTNTTSPWIVNGSIGSNGSSPAMAINPSGSIEIKGEDADIKINGKSMKSWMEAVEERLNILTPNPELEKEWDDLRRLGNRYRALEKKCKEKAQMWAALKKVQPKQP
jgi:hypothetical protein